MVEAIFNRIVDIIETGTYSGDTLEAIALRTFPDNLSVGDRQGLILPRGDSGYAHESGASFFTTVYSYDLYFYIQEAAIGADAVGIADAVNYNALATKIFLSRLQLQLAGNADIAEIAGEITWQTTSNLSTPILYPSQGVSSQQGAKFYWGFVCRLTVPYRQYIIMSSQG